MKISEQSQLLSKREILLLLIVPWICQKLFSGIMIDFFLLSLFYISFRTHVLPYFFMVFFWSIIYSIATLDNPGSELLALGGVWYFLSSFRFNTDLTKFISAFLGSIIYTMMKFCIGSMGSTWSISMTIVFSVFFIITHTLFSLMIIWVLYNIRLQGKIAG